MITNNSLRLRILLMADPAAGNGPATPPSEVEHLRAKVTALETENAELKKGEVVEKAVREKMAAGLTREQAESVVKQQADTDKEIARLEAEQKKAADEAAKKGIARK